MKYEYLEHTADEKFRAYGKNLEEKFCNAALALANIITDTSKVKPSQKKVIKVKAKRLRSLLYEFLEELVVLVDTEGWILSKIEKLEINEEELSLMCILYGDNQEYEIRTQIKSITYSDMEINEEYVQVVVDI